MIIIRDYIGGFRGVLTMAVAAVVLERALAPALEVRAVVVMPFCG